MTAAGRRDARRLTDDSQPLGVKGAGQAGCIAAPPTIIKAILVVLASLGIDHLDMPAHPRAGVAPVRPSFAFMRDEGSTMGKLCRAPRCAGECRLGFVDDSPLEGTVFEPSVPL